LPDLWDIVIGTWADDSPSARFAGENSHEPFMRGIRSVTTRPVVGVGRFTSPDTMLALVRGGVLDMIGAARPSIADPFLPDKIRRGRVEDIRECIGCNICVSSHYAMTHMRCTQNPTMGEEWRRGWHPERIAPAGGESAVLVVGAGPAGLEAARALGQRGYRVALAERRRTLGGRVSLESTLPGLATWSRVRDWRVGQIAGMDNVDVYPESNLAADDIPSMGFAHVVLAVGARWRTDGCGRRRDQPLVAAADSRVLTPDDIMAGVTVSGRVLVYDDDHYYMGAVIAEKLAREGCAVTLATPAADIAAFTAQTLELEATARRLNALGVAMLTHHELVAVEGGAVVLHHVHTAVPRSQEVDTVVLVTARVPDSALYDALEADRERIRDAGIESVTRIGDCLAPAAIVHAVYAGHRFAREFGMASGSEGRGRGGQRERIAIHHSTQGAPT